MEAITEWLRKKNVTATVYWSKHPVLVVNKPSVKAY